MKPNNRLANTALNSVADHFDRLEVSDSLQTGEISEMKNKQPPKKQKRVSDTQCSRIKITLKASEKRQLKAIAKDKDTPLATLCRDVVIEYLQTLNRC